MRPIKAFLDSDVIISSLLSSTGAAHLLVNKKSVVKYISNLSVKEIKIVAKRLGIKTAAVNRLIKGLKIILVAGAVASEARFLLSYNLKHFKIEKIKRDFNILVYRPAQFLQYLRSL